MGLFIDFHFLFEDQLLCLRLYIEDLSCKIVSGAVDAIKWSVKWKNWNISDIFFSLSSIEGRKQPETFSPYMGTIPSERARQENGFLLLKMIVLTLVTLHIQEELCGLMEIV